MARTAATDKFRIRDFGTALSFDGSNDVVTVASLSETLNNTHTIAVWVSLTADTTAYENAVWAANGIEVSFGTNNRPTVYGSGPVYGSTVFTKGHWHHVVLTRSGVTSNGYKLYVDGVLEAQTTRSDTPTSTEVYIGGKSATGYLAARIDEPRIWSRALTADEISALYYQGTVPTTGLVAEYLFNEGAGTTATDSSGNGNDGTITGATYTSDVPSYVRSAAVNRTAATGRVSV